VIFRYSSLLLSSASIAIAAEKVTFDDHVFPIFQQACLNCHNPDKAKGGLDLSTFGGTLKGGSGGKVVEPGDTGSTLINLVLHSAEPKMPPEGDKLASANVEVLKSWIEGGLLENKSSSARKPAKPKFETALRSSANMKPEGPPPVPQDVLLEPPVLTPKAAAVHAIAASPWAPLIAVTGQRQVLLHSTETLELVGILPFPEGDPVSLAFTPDARYLIVGGGIPGKSGVTVTFDVTTGARLLSAGKEFDAVLAADIRPGFDIVATGGPSKLLKLWNTETGELLKSVKKHTDWITAIDLSSDGVLLASGDRNGGVWVWESETANEFHTLRAHQAAITSLAFRADSNILGTASEDGTVRFWEMNGGSEVKKIDAHPGGVTAFAFGADGSQITAGRDMKAKLWKPDFNPARDLAEKLPALPTAVALDFENKRAFVGDALGTIRVYETADGKPVGEILANPPSIETRIKNLTDRLNNQDQTIAAAQAKAGELAKAVEVAKAEAANAQAVLQKAKEAHQTNQTGSDQAKQKLEAHRQTIANHQAEITRLSGERTAAQAQVEAQRAALAALPEDQRNGTGLAAAEQQTQQISAQITTHEQAIAEAQKADPALASAADSAAKAAAESVKQIKPVEDALAQKNQAVAATEKAAADAIAQVEHLKNEGPKLTVAAKKWAAAAINTQALQTREKAGQTFVEAEDLLDQFAVAAVALEPQTTALNSKREQREQLSQILAKPDLSPDLRDEIAATLSALDTIIEREAQMLRDLEKQALALRDSVDQTLPVAHKTQNEAERLKQAYEKARQ